MQAVGLLTEPEKEVMEASSYDIGTIYDFLKTAIDDADDARPPILVGVRTYFEQMWCLQPCDVPLDCKACHNNYRLCRWC